MPAVNVSNTSSGEIAVVLAMFGTAREAGVSALLHVRDVFSAAFPRTAVHMSFTSDVLRAIWHRRRKDKAYLRAHPVIPTEVFACRSPLAVIADLHDQGYKTLVVQAVHVAPGEEYLDLCHLVETLAGLRTVHPDQQPLLRLAVGRPVLGGDPAGKRSAGKDIRAAAAALGEDVRLAEERDAALLYMGHGSKRLPLGHHYQELSVCMEQMYPRVLTRIGILEGFPSLEQLLEELRARQTQRVILRPLLVAAGNHVVEDMTQGPASWKERLEAAGIEVAVKCQGLGESDAFTAILVRHAREAAVDAGLFLA